MLVRPRAGIVLASLLAAGGCATGGGLRTLHAEAERGTAIAERHAHAPLKPGTRLIVLNPLNCAVGASGGGGSSASSLALAVLVVGCAAVFTAVDVVALPVTGVRRHGQSRDIAAIERTCPIEDPASRAAGELARRLIEEFGFSPQPPGAGMGGAATVELVVITEAFQRSSQIAWKGTVEFHGVDGKLLWRDWCQARAPARKAAAFETECEAARAEVASLGDSCAEHVLAALRVAWSKAGERSSSQ